MPVRQKKRRCKRCSGPIPKNIMGRQRLFCSPACRQADYRLRQSRRPSAPLRALKSDLWAIEDRTARAQAAVRVLEAFGYEVSLSRIGRPKASAPTPAFTLIQGGGSSGSGPS
jgi:hypothetical protein